MKKVTATKSPKLFCLFGLSSSFCWTMQPREMSLKRLEQQKQIRLKTQKQMIQLETLRATKKWLEGSNTRRIRQQDKLKNRTPRSGSS